MLELDLEKVPVRTNERDVSYFVLNFGGVFYEGPGIPIFFTSISGFAGFSGHFWVSKSDVRHTSGSARYQPTFPKHKQGSPPEDSGGQGMTRVLFSKSSRIFNHCRT